MIALFNVRIWLAGKCVGISQKWNRCAGVAFPPEISTTTGHGDQGYWLQTATQRPFFYVGASSGVRRPAWGNLSLLHGVKWISLSLRFLISHHRCVSGTATSNVNSYAINTTRKLVEKTPCFWEDFQPTAPTSTARLNHEVWGGGGGGETVGGAWVLNTCTPPIPRESVRDRELNRKGLPKCWQLSVYSGVEQRARLDTWVDKKPQSY